MKWPQEQTDIIIDAFRQFLNSPYVDRTKIEAYCRDNGMLAVQQVMNAVAYDLQYDDTHPAYSPGIWDDGSSRPAKKRNVAYRPEFTLYPPGCNDNHRQTMLKHVAKAVGLI